MDILFALLGGIVGTLIIQMLYRMIMSVRRMNEADRRKAELNTELGGRLKAINAVQGVKRCEDHQIAFEVQVMEDRPQTLEELDARVTVAELPESLVAAVPRQRVPGTNNPGPYRFPNKRIVPASW